MWTAILQPEDNESDLERFADAPENDSDPSEPRAAGNPAAVQHADGPQPSDASDPAASAEAGQRQPGAAGAGAGAEQWPADGAYDMSKRCDCLNNIVGRLRPMHEGRSVL